MASGENGKNGPLSGILILDASIWQNGPYASVLLSDMGAEVIKIEEPERGDPGRGMVERVSRGQVSSYFEAMNRNKRSLTLDLKRAEGLEIFYRLVRRADVVVQNFRVGVAERLGIDYAALSRHNPRIITASATGFGRKGPDATHGVFDLLGTSRAGTLKSLQYTGGSLENPGGFALGDQTGALVLAHAITMALLARERFGIGQDVEVSQLGAQMLLQHLGLVRFLTTGAYVPPTSHLDVFNPIFSVYRCRDDRWIALACLQADRYWPDVCEVLGIKELQHDPRFDVMERRNANGRELVPVLDRAFAASPRDRWLAELAARQVPVAPVNDYADLAKDPQVIANEYLTELDHPLLGRVQETGIPIKLSKTPGRVRHCAPELGQHTEEILLESGYRWEDIQGFRNAGIL
jgi:crotonobetainyl-CoA:carnitine CoA-transferase CaiB-like acyl-CoA transferase